MKNKSDQYHNQDFKHITESFTQIVLFFYGTCYHSHSIHHKSFLNVICNISRCTPIKKKYICSIEKYTSIKTNNIINIHLYIPIILYQYIYKQE